MNCRTWKNHRSSSLNDNPLKRLLKHPQRFGEVILQLLALQDFFFQSKDRANTHKGSVKPHFNYLALHIFEQDLEPPKHQQQFILTLESAPITLFLCPMTHFHIAFSAFPHVEGNGRFGGRLDPFAAQQ